MVPRGNLGSQKSTRSEYLPLCGEPANEFPFHVSVLTHLSHYEDEKSDTMLLRLPCSYLTG